MTSQMTHHDAVIKGKHFPRYLPFLQGIRRSPVNSPHKGQWRWAVMFPLICAWINSWINNREAGYLRRHAAHYQVTVMDIDDAKTIGNPGLAAFYSLASWCQFVSNCGWKWQFAVFVNTEHFCHMNTYHLKVDNTFSKINHTVNQNTKSLTMTPTSFLKETCYIFCVWEKQCLTSFTKFVNIQNN